MRHAGHYEAAITSYNQALEIKQDDYWAWHRRGLAQERLGLIEDALSSFDKALEAKPNDPEACYDKACCYAGLGNIEQAIKNLRYAINQNFDLYSKLAKKDAKFNTIRTDNRFLTLIEDNEGMIDGAWAWGIGHGA